MKRVRAPGPMNVIGVSNIAPAIMRFGTPELLDLVIRGSNGG